MTKQIENNDVSLYKQQENLISAQSEAFLELLTKRGILEDHSIQDEQIRKAQKDKRHNMYHNTLMLLRNYRTIVWALECFPIHLAEELDTPLNDLDALISSVSTQIGLDNAKLENRLQSIQKSRLLLDRFNEALSVLQKKPDNGQMMYDILFHTFLTPEHLTHEEILYHLNISSRHYYRLRQQAINILSIRLWASPGCEVDCWLEVLTLLESL